MSLILKSLEVPYGLFTTALMARNELTAGKIMVKPAASNGLWQTYTTHKIRVKYVRCNFTTIPKSCRLLKGPVIGVRVISEPVCPGQVCPLFAWRKPLPSCNALLTTIVCQKSTVGKRHLSISACNLP